MTGKGYADLIAAYIAHVYGTRGIQVYREIHIGKSVIGKNRRLDVFVHDVGTNRALAIECKYQQSQGTADEKIPYTLKDIEALWMPGCIVYAGAGFSDGVIHMLQSSATAAYCLPNSRDLQPTADTREFDHIVATVFGWWDVLLNQKRPFDLAAWQAGRPPSGPPVYPD